jgi:GNAT superfamily N-acetyltransferase
MSDEVDYGLEDEHDQRLPSRAEAAAYLSDPRILHWVAEENGIVVGHLACHLIPARAGARRELLLYDIGTRAAHRRRGVGHLLVAALRQWMKETGVEDVWVLAEPEARSFYEACGFVAAPEQPHYMLLALGEAAASTGRK